MCLVTNNKLPFVSTNNIECYKILISRSGKLYTPFRDFLFNTEMHDTADEHVVYCFGVYLIESGFFHAYQTLEIAKEQYKKLNKACDINGELRIYKAIIPPNTKYYIGKREDICAKSMKIIEQIK